MPTPKTASFRNSLRERENRGTFIVRDIDVVQVDGSREYYEVTHYDDYIEYIPPEMGTYQYITEEIEKEVIVPKRFINHRENYEMRIGLSKKVWDFIGIHLEAWENMEKEYENAIAAVHRKTRIIDDILDWSFWRRLKFLFMRKI